MILRFIKDGKVMDTLLCSRVFFIISIFLLLIKLILDQVNYENRVAYHARYLQDVDSDLNVLHWSDTPIFFNHTIWIAFFIRNNQICDFHRN